LHQMRRDNGPFISRRCWSVRRVQGPVRRSTR
jgi:hypothetical protein